MIYMLDVIDDVLRNVFLKIVGNKVIYLLINNVGYYGDNKELGKLDIVEWLNVFEVNSIVLIKMVEVLCFNLVNVESVIVVLLSSKMGFMMDNIFGGVYFYCFVKVVFNVGVKLLLIDLVDEKIKVVMLYLGWVLIDMGGLNVFIDVQILVQGMWRVIDGFKVSQSGDFIVYDGMVVFW